MPGNRLNSQSREMVIHLLAYFQKEKENGEPLESVNSIQDRVAIALNISKRTVCSIKLEKIENPVLSSPSKKRPRIKTKTTVVKDSSLIKRVLVTDFQKFSDKIFVNNKDVDPVFSNSLFNLNNPHWKDLRSKISKSFSPSKVKAMMRIAKKCANNLKTYLENNVDKSLDVKDVTIRYSTEVISNCVFGVNFNCFVKKPNLFAHYAHNIFPKSYVGTFKGFTYAFLPQLVKIFKYQFFDDASCEFFYKIFSEIIEQRQNLNIKRYDLIDILIDLKKENDENLLFDQNQLLSQAVSFLAVGHETLSSIVALTIYHLSMDDKTQTRLRDEINDVIEQYGDITLESLADMEYLQMVINETLRMYPVIQYIQRRCIEDCFIPETGIVIERGRKFALLNLKVSILYFVKYFQIEQDGSEKLVFGSSHSLEPMNRMLIKLTKI
ncbi:hypothetical protein RN001_008055 [Aquatica leii]|uniref:Cytochrome P450 n=1 Tax=Aquatica leii TaxID=1421715 RepID=A0AAN7P9T3_9COLE|nr:hypothetical protein RN001_008055 [Aquatica leii]